MSLRSRQHIWREQAAAPGGMVAARRTASAEAGVEMLRAGGNAIDAAIAVGFVSCVLEPMMTALGGCGFLMFHEASSGKSYVVDFAPRAPAGARPDMFEVLDRPASPMSLSPADVKDEANASGHLAAGVPGLVKGLCAAHQRWGKLPLARVMEPAIHWAENGVVCDWYTGYMIAADLQWLRRYPEAARIYAPGGYVPDTYTAQKIVQRDMADTLRRIARDGAKAFYEGEIAHAIEDDMRANGGILTAADLAAFDVEVYEPLSINYRGYEVQVPRAPTGSWTIAEKLRILEHFDIGSFGHNSAEHLHTLIEAARLAFADRYYHFGDPAYVSVPLEGVLSDGYVRELAGRIDPSRSEFDANAALEPWQAFAYEARHDPWRFDPGERPAAPWIRPAAGRDRDHTTHFSIVDREGNAVSNTYTLNDAFGSHVTIAGTGMLLNDEMDDFSAIPGQANQFGLIQGSKNEIAAHKRPLSSMAPTIVLDRENSLWLVIGARGGPRIISTVVQSIVNLIDHGMDLQAAIDAPRLHHQWLPDEVQWEQWGLSVDTRRLLESRGHLFAAKEGVVTRATAVMIESGTGMRLGAVDGRGSGAAVGY